MEIQLPNGYVIVRYFSTWELRRFTDEDRRQARSFPSIFIKGWPLPAIDQVKPLFEECREIASRKMDAKEADEYSLRKEN